MKLWDDQKAKEARMHDCDIYNSNKHKTKTYTTTWTSAYPKANKSKQIHLYLAIK